MKDMNFGSEIQDVELGVRGFVAPASRRHFPAPFEIRKNRRPNAGVPQANSSARVRLVVYLHQLPDRGMRIPLRGG